MVLSLVDLREPVGDVGGELAQLLASIEAIVGQVYLVTFVAFLVSLYATERAQP